MATPAGTGPAGTAPCRCRCRTGGWRGCSPTRSPAPSAPTAAGPAIPRWSTKPSPFRTAPGWGRPGTAAAPQALVTPAASGEFYWVGDGTVENGALRVLYNSYRRTGSGSLDFTLTGTALATIALPGLTVTSVTPLSLGSTIAWGSALL